MGAGFGFGSVLEFDLWFTCRLYIREVLTVPDAPAESPSISLDLLQPLCWPITEVDHLLLVLVLVQSFSLVVLILHLPLESTSLSLVARPPAAAGLRSFLFAPHPSGWGCEILGLPSSPSSPSSRQPSPRFFWSTRPTCYSKTKGIFGYA